MNLYHIEIELQGDGWDYDFRNYAVRANSDLEASQKAWNFAQENGLEPNGERIVGEIDTVGPEMQAI